MAEYISEDRDFSFRDLPTNPEDGQVFIIKDENDAIIVKAQWDEKKGKWIKIK